MALAQPALGWPIEMSGFACNDLLAPTLEPPMNHAANQSRIASRAASARKPLRVAPWLLA